MNWSSPRDASWITCDKTLKCQSVGDILLVLKSSDRIQDQLTDPYSQCTSRSLPASIPTTYYLILRQWSNLHPSQEFRIFIRNNQLLAACQRDPNLYPHLQNESVLDDIKDNMEIWFEDEIQQKMKDNVLQDYILDIYIDTNDRVWLIDVKPFSTSTDSILYTWQELVDLPIPTNIPADDEEGPAFELRTIANKQQELYLPRIAAIIAARLPSDGIDVSDQAGIESFINLCKVEEARAQLIEEGKL